MPCVPFLALPADTVRRLLRHLTEPSMSALRVGDRVRVRGTPEAGEVVSRVGPGGYAALVRLDGPAPRLVVIRPVGLLEPEPDQADVPHVVTAPPSAP